MKYLVTVFTSIALSGCVGFERVQHHDLPPQRPDRALVYFYREDRFEGSIVGNHIVENGRELGSMRNASFFYIYATPGEHIYEMHSPLNMPIQRRLTLAAGKTYYLQGGATLSIMNEQEGAAALDHLHMMNSAPPQ